MPDISIKMTIKLTPGTNYEFFDDAENLFRKYGLEAEYAPRYLAIKDFGFPEFIVFVGSHLAGRYLLDPVIKNIEGFVKDWTKLTYAKFTRQIKVTVHFQELGITFETVPYIDNKEYLGNLWENLQKIVSLIYQEKIENRVRLIKFGLPPVF